MKKARINLVVKTSNEMTYWVKNVNSKTTVVMLHGLGSSASFASKLGAFDINFNVISLDLPGSTNGHLYPELTVQDIANKVSHFIRHHIRSKNIVLLGHSLGGAVAAHVASENKKVDGVIYLSPFTPNLADSKQYKIASNYMSLGTSKIDTAKKVLLGGALKAVAKTFGFRNLNAFTDEDSNEYSLLKYNVYNKKYISKVLLEKYQSVKQPNMFIISKKDIVVSSEGVSKFAKKIKKNIIILEGNEHNPLRTSTKEVVDILNEKIKFEKRAFGRKIIEL